MPSEDQKVIDLLAKMKSTGGGGYPSELLAARRNQYVRQAANIGLGIGLGVGVKNTMKGAGNGAGTTATTITSKILETALIAAIAIEAGTVAFIYRDRIRDAISTYTSSPTQQVAAPLSVSDPNAQKETQGQDALPSSITSQATSTPTVTLTLSPTGTLTPLPTGTATPGQAAGQNNNNSAPGAGANVVATKTPKGNNGNQYGLTPKPERTKEKKDNDNNPASTETSGGGNDNNGGGKKDK